MMIREQIAAWLTRMLDRELTAALDRVRPIAPATGIVAVSIRYTDYEGRERDLHGVHTMRRGSSCAVALTEERLIGASGEIYLDFPNGARVSAVLNGDHMLVSGNAHGTIRRSLPVAAFSRDRVSVFFMWD
jgi:hypothetical protein